MKRLVGIVFLVCLACVSCEVETPGDPDAAHASGAQALVNKYTTVPLTADLSGFDVDDRRVLELLIEASAAMDDAFWKQAYGDKGKLLASVPPIIWRSSTATSSSCWASPRPSAFPRPAPSLARFSGSWSSLNARSLSTAGMRPVASK